MADSKLELSIDQTGLATDRPEPVAAGPGLGTYCKLPTSTLPTISQSTSVDVSFATTGPPGASNLAQKQRRGAYLSYCTLGSQASQLWPSLNLDAIPCSTPACRAICNYIPLEFHGFAFL